MQRCNVGRGVIWLACLVVGSLVCSAAAQDAPYQGVVAEDRVDVLAGGSRRFYVVGYLSKGAIVTVKEVIEGYNAITPPPGVASYISKAFVDAKGNGKTGVVSADHAPVKAAGVNGVSDNWKFQLDLPRGATVSILGEEGSFYKIATPPNVSVYLPPGAVRRLETAGAPAATPPVSAPPVEATPAPPETPAPAASPETPETPDHAAPVPQTPEHAAAQPLALATTEPAAAAGPSGTPESTEAPATQSATTQPAKHKHKHHPKSETPATQVPVLAPNQPSQATPTFIQAKAQTPEVQALEARLADAQKLPLEQQPLEDFVTAYTSESMNPNLPAGDQRIVMTRILQLKRSEALAAALKSLQAATAEAGGATPMPVPDVTPAGYRPGHYDLVGLLLASGVYNGDSGPRLYRLVEPASDRTIGYVQAEQVDPARFLGRIVGINGQSKYDPALTLNIIDVGRIELLQPAATEPSK